MPKRELPGISGRESADYLCCRLSNKLYLKVADLAALQADYYKSIENYEKVAKSSVSNNLMKWSVKDYFLKAGMCHLATNVSFHNYLVFHGVS